MRKRVYSLLLALCIVLLPACAPIDSAPQEDGKLHIVATVFPAYDFARAAAGDLAEVTLLLPPGTESHSYEPTPADILAVQNCDLFLYLGGESDAWVDTILEAVEPQGRVVRMVDCVDLLEEESVEGMQGGHDHSHDHGAEACEEDHGHGAEEHLGEVVGMDEHVWTSPRNAAVLTRTFGAVLAEIDGENRQSYLDNAERYAAEIDELDAAFAAFFETCPNRTIVFGDRFPLLYFAHAYELEYYAAFPGCGTQTEPSAATVAFLTEKVRQEEIPAIWYIEFSNHLVADSIAEAVDAQTAMFHTCHNVSPDELERGETYLSLMEKNLETLKNYL